MIKPVIVWDNSATRISSGSSWLSVASGGTAVARLRGRDSLLALSGALRDGLGVNAGVTPVTGTLQVGSGVGVSRYIDLICDGRSLALHRELAANIHDWLCYLLGQVPLATVQAEVASVRILPAPVGVQLVLQPDGARQEVLLTRSGAGDLRDLILEIIGQPYDPALKPARGLSVDGSVEGETVSVCPFGVLEHDMVIWSHDVGRCRVRLTRAALAILAERLDTITRGCA